MPITLLQLRHLHRVAQLRQRIAAHAIKQAVALRAGTGLHREQRRRRQARQQIGQVGVLQLGAGNPPGQDQKNDGQQ